MVCTGIYPLRRSHGHGCNRRARSDSYQKIPCQRLPPHPRAPADCWPLGFCWGGVYRTDRFLRFVLRMSSLIFDLFAKVPHFLLEADPAIHQSFQRHGTFSRHSNRNAPQFFPFCSRMASPRSTKYLRTNASGTKDRAHTLQTHPTKTWLETGSGSIPRRQRCERLWEEGATEDILEFLGEVRAGCWQATRVRAPVEAENEGAVSEGEEGGPGPP